MIENWREFLYPLGFLSSLAFGTRVLVQWFTSELKQKSIVNKAFWRISLLGNVLLMFHSFIQVQFHVCLTQALNAVISWRNLNLMQSKSHRITFPIVCLLLIMALGITFMAFFIQDLFFLKGGDAWFRIPVTSWHHKEETAINNIWHLFGFVGLILFSCRFWIQWWYAEKYQTSYLSSAFWWISLLGDMLCLIYFFRILDPVNLIGPTLGLIPYIRNLILIKNQNISHQTSRS